jgi:hypothetical protein
VLVAIIKTRLNLTVSLYQILQILSLTLFEKIPLDQLLNFSTPSSDDELLSNQLNLFT